jgi:hypothetical protein
MGSMLRCYRLICVEKLSVMPHGRSMNGRNGSSGSLRQSPRLFGRSSRRHLTANISDYKATLRSATSSGNCLAHQPLRGVRVPLSSSVSFMAANPPVWILCLPSTGSLMVSTASLPMTS